MLMPVAPRQPTAAGRVQWPGWHPAHPDRCHAEDGPAITPAITPAALQR